MPGKKRQTKKKKTEGPKTSLKEKLSEVLELPKEIVMNMPKLTMVGNSDLVIENYKGIIEYESGRIRLNTGIGVLKITGERLSIEEITSEDVIVRGEIETVEFLK